VRWRTAVARQRTHLVWRRISITAARGLKSFADFITAWRRVFAGGVADKYFRDGIPVRLMPGERGQSSAAEGVGKPSTSGQGRRRQGCRRSQVGVWNWRILLDASRQNLRSRLRRSDRLAAALRDDYRTEEQERPGQRLGVISRAEGSVFMAPLACAASGRLAKVRLVSLARDKP